MKSNLILSVILPTYDEADNIRLIVPKISKLFDEQNIKGEIIVVDDNSPDGTANIATELANKYPVRVHVRKVERGLATAVIKGFELAQGDICLVMDADLSHPVKKILEIIEPIIKRQSDVTVSSSYTNPIGCGSWFPTINPFDVTNGFMAMTQVFLDVPKLCFQ